MGMVPAGCYRNRDYFSEFIATAAAGEALLPLFDPQTSGGMLLALPETELTGFLSMAATQGLFAVEIGVVTARKEKGVEVS